MTVTPEQWIRSCPRTECYTTDPSESILMENQGYRDADIRPFCGYCRDTAVGTCLRCGRPLCEAHVHAEDRRCAACEAAFARLNPLDGSLALLGIAVSALPFMLSGWPRLECPSWLERIQSRRRERFLRKRPARGWRDDL
jgi:hypothetical protein